MMPTLLLLAVVAAPPGEAPSRIEVHPAKVSLASRRASTQFVVTGHYPGGEVRDLTAEATYAPAGDAVELRDGVAYPRKNGRTEITVTVAGRTAKVPVEVGGQDRPDPVRFRTEVQAALSKQGCNGGSCHGSPQGKGGFGLSLFGYDPIMDEESLVRGGLNRRIDLFTPGESLLLKKPLMRLPHVGGKKLAPKDAAYGVLLGWIKEGAKTNDEAAPACTSIAVYPGKARVLRSPHLTQQLAVLATFADGSVRDVTALATYETSHKDIVHPDDRGRVTGFKRGQGAVSVRYLNHMESVHFTVIEDVPGFTWPNPPAANLVDELVHAKLKQLQVPPSDVCDDATFLRRVHLDLTGMLPAADAARAFLTGKSPDKRAKAIDALLETEEFARFWGQRSADLMRVTARGLPDGRAERFSSFLADAYRKNTPFDKLALDILTATGDGTDVPAVNYFLAIPTPEDLTETTAQLFMGSRINCAKCHNHPFENWTQEDYYRISAVFARVRKQGDDIVVAAAGEVKHPTSGKVMAPFAVGAIPDEGADRRSAFARWLTGKGNPFFARVEVNRIWAALLGRGIVHPVDDFRSSNPPANPELLDGLAAEFEKSGFDRKRMIRLICNSRAYQRGTAVLPLNAEDEALFSHARIRRLSAEQMQDAIGLVTGSLRSPADLPAEAKRRENELSAAIEKLKADQHKWEATGREKVTALPWWAGVWHAVGPFPAKAKAKADVFPPEMGFDPTQSYEPGALRWVKHADWLEGRTVDLKQAAGTFYLTRQVFTRDAGKAEVVIEKKQYAYKLWVGSDLVFDSEKDKNRADGQTWRVPLTLGPGTHRLLFKVTKTAGNSPLRIVFTPPGGKAPASAFSPEVTELLAIPAADRTKEQAESLFAARADGDATVRKLHGEIRRLTERTEYATQRPLPEGTEFLRAFGQPKRESPCACERTDEPTVDQALQLLNGGLVADRVRAAGARYASLTDEKLTEELYLAAFARFPTADERAKVAGYLKRKAAERSDAVLDVVWAVLNTREFLLQH